MTSRTEYSKRPDGLHNRWELLHPGRVDGCHEDYDSVSDAFVSPIWVLTDVVNRPPRRKQ